MYTYICIATKVSYGQTAGYQTGVHVHVGNHRIVQWWEGVRDTNKLYSCMISTEQHSHTLCKQCLNTRSILRYIYIIFFVRIYSKYGRYIPLSREPLHIQHKNTWPFTRKDISAISTTYVEHEMVSISQPCLLFCMHSTTARLVHSTRDNNMYTRTVHMELK